MRWPPRGAPGVGARQAAAPSPRAPRRAPRSRPARRGRRRRRRRGNQTRRRRRAHRTCPFYVARVLSLSPKSATMETHTRPGAPRSRCQRLRGLPQPHARADRAGLERPPGAPPTAPTTTTSPVIPARRGASFSSRPHAFRATASVLGAYFAARRTHPRGPRFGLPRPFLLAVWCLTTGVLPVLPLPTPGFCASWRPGGCPFACSEQFVRRHAAKSKKSPRARCAAVAPPRDPRLASSRGVDATAARRRAEPWPRRRLGAVGMGDGLRAHGVPVCVRREPAKGVSAARVRTQAFMACGYLFGAPAPRVSPYRASTDLCGLRLSTRSGCWPASQCVVRVLVPVVRHRARVALDARAHAGLLRPHDARRLRDRRRLRRLCAGRRGARPCTRVHRLVRHVVMHVPLFICAGAGPGPSSRRGYSPPRPPARPPRSDAAAALFLDQCAPRDALDSARRQRPRARRALHARAVPHHLARIPPPLAGHDVYSRNRVGLIYHRGGLVPRAATWR